MDLDTGQVRSLGGLGSFRGLPSPNGRRIAYVASVDAVFRYRVEVAEVDDGAVEVVAEALDGSVIGWGPDNRSLLISLRMPGADDPAATEAQVLTPGGGTHRVSPIGIDANPIGWSPVSNLIAYQAPDGTHVVRPDGSGDRLVQPWGDGDYRQMFASGWSPVGSELLFSVIDGKRDDQFRPRNDHAIFALDPITGIRRELARPAAPPGYARWSPDGSAVAYTTEVEEGPLVWTTGGPIGEIAHELDWTGTGSELVAIRPTHGDEAREVVAIRPGGSVRIVLGARPGGTYFNIAAVPGTRFAVVDIAPEGTYR
jgi:dipeptidyl aminopeptidase/acylaminoacyl peptidase